MFVANPNAARDLTHLMCDFCIFDEIRTNKMKREYIDEHHHLKHILYICLIACTHFTRVYDDDNGKQQNNKSDLHVARFVY